MKKAVSIFENVTFGGLERNRWTVTCEVLDAVLQVCSQGQGEMEGVTGSAGRWNQVTLRG